jgi:hypothetical protein
MHIFLIGSLRPEDVPFAELSLVTADLVRVFREISTVEPDDDLRLVVEAAATRMSTLHERADVFLGAEEAASQIADEAKAFAVQPLRVIIACL